MSAFCLQVHVYTQCPSSCQSWHITLHASCILLSFAFFSFCGLLSSWLWQIFANLFSHPFLRACSFESVSVRVMPAMGCAVSEFIAIHTSVDLFDSLPTTSQQLVWLLKSGFNLYTYSIHVLYRGMRAGAQGAKNCLEMRRLIPILSE